MKHKNIFIQDTSFGKYFDLNHGVILFHIYSREHLIHVDYFPYFQLFLNTLILSSLSLLFQSFRHFLYITYM